MIIANLLFIASLFYYVNVPFANMREQPTHESEIASQAYYSEPVNLIEEQNDWIKIETAVDHYPGWIKKEQLCTRQEPFLSNSNQTVAKVTRSMAHLYHVKDTVFGPIMTIPFESLLQVVDASDNRWIKVTLVDGREAYIQRGDIQLNPTPISRNQLCSFSMQFLGLPYTWGGRSSFGYDCSGFVQMLYRQMGIYIPRDSRQQVAWDGFNAIEMEDLTPGDLILFGAGPDKIRHVGLYLGEGQFIHATVAENAPYIHISRLSDSEWNGNGKWTYRTARALKESTLKVAMMKTAIAK